MNGQQTDLYLIRREEEYKKLRDRIAELEAVIKSHGIPVKSFCGGEEHYCMKESE